MSAGEKERRRVHVRVCTDEAECRREKEREEGHISRHWV